jgi:hypothetical protein
VHAIYTPLLKDLRFYDIPANCWLLSDALILEQTAFPTYHDIVRGKQSIGISNTSGKQSIFVLSDSKEREIST